MNDSTEDRKAGIFQVIISQLLSFILVSNNNIPKPRASGAVCGESRNTGYITRARMLVAFYQAFLLKGHMIKIWTQHGVPERRIC